jgi:hypothetical protein
MMKDAESSTAFNGFKINVVLNWTEELKRVLKTGKQ